MVQALDSHGLGIGGLDLTSDSGVRDAISRIDQAINQAAVRSEALKSLSRALGSQDDFTAIVNQVLSQAVAGRRSYSATAETGSASLGRGSLANVRT
jgi:hypothetical protein